MKKHLIALLLAVSTISLIGCGQAEQIQEEKSIAVSVQAAKGGEIENTNTFSGTTKIKTETAVTVEIGGVIQEMNVQLGDHVTKGQSLLKIDGKDVENGVKLAEAQLKSAQAGYSDTETKTQNQLETALNNAKASYDEAKRKFDYTEELYQAGAVSENDYKQVTYALESAKLALDSAQKSYDIGVGEQIKVGIEQAQVSLEKALLSRDKLTLTSPVDGVITAKNFDVNEMANQGQPAFIISSTDVLQIDLNITQADIDKFTEGQKVDVIIEGQTVEGTVNNVPTVADSSSSLYKVEVLVDNADGQFKSGMSAEVEVSIEKQDNVITVPKKAIVEDDGIKYVYTVGDDNRAVKNEVTTGIETANTVEIKSGVSADDTVVIGGLSLISDNTKLFPVVKED